MSGQRKIVPTSHQLFLSYWQVLSILLCALLCPTGTGKLFAQQHITLSGIRYVSLTEVADRLDMAHHGLSGDQEVHLQNATKEIILKANQRDIRINGTRVFLGNTTALRGRDLYISELDFTHTIQPVVNPHGFGERPPLQHIVIDPGHGGRDGGAYNPRLGLNEKDPALAVSHLLAEKLRRQGFRVSLTREDDTFLSLRERTTFANESGADLFISIHFNASTASSVRGVETYVHPPQFQPPTRLDRARPRDNQAYTNNRYDPWNALIGYHIHKELAQKLGTIDRGLKRDRFLVLLSADCPAVLVEGGFLSNHAEGSRIATRLYQETLAEAIANGVMGYKVNSK